MYVLRNMDLFLVYSTSRVGFSQSDWSLTVNKTVLFIARWEILDGLKPCYAE